MRIHRLVVVTLLLIGGSAFAATPSLTLAYPVGGEVFTAGTTQQVRLVPKAKVSPVTAELSIDGGTTFTSIGTITVPKTGTPTLSFSVPNTPSGNCIVRVSGSGRSGKATASSAPFSIFAATGVAPGSVTTVGLADGSVTNPKLAPSAVTNDKVSSGSASNNFVLTADGAGNANWIQTTGLTGVLPVISGGTGQSSFTNGQLLIGNTTGNTLTKATLTGTANQVLVANGAGSITLSTPQNIGTSSDVTFNSVTAGQFNGNGSGLTNVPSSFADFFALMPGDNAATVAAGSAVQFPQNGPSNNISRSSASQFTLPAIGTYQVSFQVSVTEAGQLVVALDTGGGPTELAYTVAGRATGTSQIVGTCLVTTTVINTTLTIQNPSGNSPALTITPLAGGTHSVSAHLVIVRLK